MKDIYDLKDAAMRRAGGKVRGKAFYRCGKCRAAKRLNRELWLYIRPPRCACGAIHWQIDLSRTREYKERKGPYNSCHCNGYSYPHRVGGGIQCIHWVKRCGDDEMYFIYGPEFC